MDLQYYGANCIRISTKKVTVVIDDNLDELGLKSITKPTDVVLSTDGQDHHADTAQFAISAAGEYEVLDVSISGVAARAHIGEPGTKQAVMYRLIIDDVRIGVVGHIHPDLSETQLEALGVVDVLFVPVGGNGFTLDGLGALKIIKAVEPKIVIPTSYADKDVKYPVVATELEEALKVVSMEAGEPLDTLKLKGSDMPEGAKLIVLKRQ